MSDEKKWFIFGMIGVFFILSSINSILNKKKINNESDYLMSLNTFMLGVLFLFLFLASLLFYQYGKTVIKENAFYLIMIAGISFGFFIVGMHAILNKKKIHNLVFLQFSKTQLGGAIIGFIALIVLLLQGFYK